jgi:putative endonuclease
LKTFELGTREEALRLEARIKKLERSQKEQLVAGDEALTAALLESLSA